MPDSFVVLYLGFSSFSLRACSKYMESTPSIFNWKIIKSAEKHHKISCYS